MSVDETTCRNLCVAGLILSHAFSAMLGAEVKAQFLPPPPVVVSESTQNKTGDGFTAADRTMLRNTYNLARSLWTVFNRNKLEQQIIDNPTSN